MPWHDYASKTAKQIEEIVAAGRAVAVLPVGAIEQHGPHLPVGTDSYISQSYAKLALEKTKGEADFLLLPGITYALSVEHRRMPATLTLSATTVLAVLQDIGASLQRGGIGRLVLLNCHGGNEHILQVAAREIHGMGLQVYLVDTGKIMGRMGLESYAIHAEKMETSVMMALYPQYVQEGEITPKLDASVENWRRIADENADLIETWFIDDYAVDGVVGQPGAASPQFGRDWVEGITNDIAKALDYVASLA